jgi:membrane associated rhomboid family serine protease
MERIPRTATVAISVVTALLWLFATLIASPEQTAMVLGFIPARFSGLVQLPGAVPAFLTPFTATLAHANIYHLAFNLLIFIWCGSQVERVLGRVGLIALYLVGAYASALAQWLSVAARPITDPAWLQPTIGASGAISAIVGAYALSFGRAKRVTGNLRTDRWINVAWLMVAWIVLQIMMGWLGNQQGYLLATPAHIGGFAAGLLLQRPLLLFHYRNA